MKFSLAFVALILCWSQIGDCRPVLKKPLHRPSILKMPAQKAHRMTPSEYAIGVNSLSSCQFFFERIGSWPNANELMNSFLVNHASEINFEGKFAKGEFEKNSAFYERVQNIFQHDLGDLSRIILEIPIEPSAIKYNADLQEAKISLPISVNRGGDYFRLKINERFSGSEYYIAQNKFGASVEVEKFRVSTSTLDTGLNSVWVMPFSTSNEFSVQISVDLVPAFKNNAKLVVWTSLTYPYYKREILHDKATMDDPTEIYHHNDIWQGSVKCAAITNGEKVIKVIVG